MMNDGLMTANSTSSFCFENVQAVSSACLFDKRYGPSSIVASRCQSSSVNSLPLCADVGFCGVTAAVDDVRTTRLTLALAHASKMF